MNDGSYLKVILGFRKILVLKDLSLLEAGTCVSYNSQMGMNLQETVDLVRRVRHDANNPLTAALGHVQLLLDDPAITDPEARESLQVVESELRRLTEILRQLNEVKN